MPYANKLIKKLYNSGLKLYIATNGVAKVQHQRLSNQKFMKYISGLLISEELEAQKPSVKFFENASIKTGINFKNDTIIIGDSLSSDIKGGIDYGIDTLWVNFDNKKNTLDKEITYIVKNLKEIPKLICK